MTYRIAIGTLDGIEVTEHFGQGKNFQIIEIDQQSEETKVIGNIEVVHSEACGSGHDENLIQEKIQAFLDWKVIAVVVRQIGLKSERLMIKNGIEVLVFTGKIADGLEKIKRFYNRRNF